jgi:K+/H+ antiporter YhaU regulatory subunit KhtT
LSQRQELQRQEIESLESERASIATQMSELIAQASRIEQQITKLQTTPTLEFKLAELPDFMEKTFGVCQVQASAVPYEFFIKKDDV